MPVNPRSPLLRRAVAAFAVCSAIAAFIGIRRDPGVALLIPRGPARWILAAQDVTADAIPSRLTSTYFRRDFFLDAPRAVALEIRALRSAQASVDGRLVLGASDPARWKEPRRLTSGPLTAGAHRIDVAVANADGPPALRVYSEDAPLSSDAQWQVSRDGKAWLPARLADERTEIGLTAHFESAGAAAVRASPLCGLVFALVFALSWKFQAGRTPAWLEDMPSKLRWALLALWAGLAINNWSKLSPEVGFDVIGHLNYIDYIVAHHRIPLANEGWQMFDAPLYHVLGAPLTVLESVSPFFYLRVLRLISYACGAALVELCYRALRLAFPARGDLQGLGLVVGGLLPMNLYMSQSIGNEPLCAALSAAAIVLLWRLAKEPAPPKTRSLIALGAVLGVAALAKATAFLLVGLGAVFLFDRIAAPRRALRGSAVVLAAAAAVCGWYYLRNWILLGRPFVGGWDPATGLSWWQMPGYRTPRQFVFDLRTLQHPVYASFAGFWDSLYSSFWLDGGLSAASDWKSRPPWDLTAMLAGAWWAVPMTVAILLGAAKAVFGRDRRDPLRAFSALAVAAYLIAMLSLFLRVPFYCVSKATYTLGLLPCYAVLAASGFETLGRGRPARAALHALTACWALLSYGAYFVR